MIERYSMRFGVSVLSVAIVALVFVSFVPSVSPSTAEASPSFSASVDLSDPTASLVVQAEGDSAFDSVLSYARAEGIDVTFSSWATGILTLSADDSVAAAGALARITGVSSVSSERKASTLFTPDDDSLSNQWSLDTINAYEAWDLGRGSHDVVVAVLDTGIDWNHPDLGANMWSNDDGYHGYNFIEDNWFPMDDNVNGYDEDGTWLPNIYTYHGTHVAGVIGAVIDNSEGIAGLAQVQLMAVKVMNDSGEGTDATVASGLRWATDNGADIVTMSLGVDGMSLTLQNAVEYASDRGVVLVAAAGNSGTSEVTYPAAYPTVIAVGATDSSDRRATFSNFGVGLDVMAPGVNIYSTQGGGSYQYLSGTSAAAPHVAGVAAIMLSINPALSPAEVGSYINSTATDLSMTGYDTSTGWGIVNAFGAVESIASPMVSFTDYPEYIEPNGTFSITWLVSGGDPGNIQETHIAWGPSADSLTDTSATYTGTTWAEFTEAGIEAPGQNGTLYLKAYATVDGDLYESEMLEIPVHDAVSDSFFTQFLKDVQDFIFNDLGLFNFLLVLAILIAVPLIVVAARPKRRRVVVQHYAAPAPANLHQYQAVQGVPHVPPPPPPPPRFEAYVDVVGQEIVPKVVRVIEGTKVVWVNRAWAPPPGVAIRSGRLDATGEHPDSLFQSGLLIAPGDYWSVTFHRAGEYEYYLTGIWKPAKIIVEPYRQDQPPQVPAA